MLGPSGPVTMLLMLTAALLGMVVVGRSRRWPLQLGSGVVSLLVAVVLGISSVNAYYGYYQSWGALFGDLRADNGAPAAPAQLPLFAHADRPPAGTDPATAPLDPRPWSVRHLPFPGRTSRVGGRDAVVLLPPGRRGPLPVLVLVHGEPGAPDSWTGGLQLASVLRREYLGRRIGPMAVVLPDVSDQFPDQQCLDAPSSRLGTYLGSDVPGDVRAELPVSPPGRSWVVGGLSEGAYCAADLVLHRPALFAGAALLDGYFHPALTSQVLRRVFAGDPTRASAHDPTRLVAQWPPGRPLPRFWLMAGTANAQDYRRTVAFGTLLAQRQDVRLLSVLGARHTTPAWRTALPDLLRWAWLTSQGHSYGGSLTVPLQ